MTWLRSWKVRPNWAVLIASRRGLLLVEPMLMYGFWVTGNGFQGSCEWNIENETMNYTYIRYVFTRAVRIQYTGMDM